MSKNDEVSNLISKSFQSDTNMFCCSCKLVFTIQETDVPLLLPCKHSACFRCVKQNAKNGYIDCLSCENKCKLPEITDPENVQSFLPINYYLIAKIYQNYDTLKRDKSRLPRRCKQNNKPFPKPITNRRFASCAECKKSSAIYFCKQCNSKFCDSCFDRIHSAFQFMKEHSKIPTVLLEYFREFRTSRRENTAVSNSSKNHDAVTDADTTKECDEFNEHIDENKMHLLNVSSKLYEVLNNIQTGAVNFENTEMFKTFKNKITDNFLKAHSVLQVAEFDLLRKLASFSYGDYSDLKTDLSQNYNKLHDILSVMNYRVEPKYKDLIDYKLLNEEIEKASKFPCQLEIVDESQCPTLSVNENLLNLMENFCQLTFPKSRSFKVNPLPKAFNPEIKVGIKTNEKNIMCEEPIHENVPDVPKNVKPQIKPKSTGSSKGYVKNCVTENQKKAGKQMNSIETPFLIDTNKRSHPVEVSHAEGPHDFHVRLKNAKPFIAKISRKMIDIMTPFTTEDVFNSGEIVAFYDEAKDFCHRVVIVDPNKSDAKSVVVQFIDSGHYGTVSISSLRSVTEYFKKMSPLVLSCTLADCKPISGKWNVDAVSLMHLLLDSCENCYVYYKNSTTPMHKVNLMIRPKAPQYLRYSLRDALIFLGHAQTTGSKIKIDDTFYAKSKIYKDISKADLKSDDEVQIVNVVSPEEFYLRKITCDKSFNELSDLLNSTYKIDNNIGLIPLPQIGYIVACYTDDLKWCRGRVETVIDHKSIQVSLLDYGKTTFVSWNMIRELLDKFYEIGPMAVRCFLYGIKPYKDNWDSEATSILVKISQSWAPSDVQVLTDHPSQVFGVKLHGCLNGKKILTNEYFVEKKLAKRISIIPHDLKNPIENKEIETDIDKKSLDANKIPVKILSAVNPSLIYVSLESDAKKIAMLSGEMQEFYRNNQPTKSDWKNGDRCAALCSNTKKWCRGIIEDVKGETCRVYFRDTSLMENVQMDNVRDIQECFSCVEDGAVKCSLSGIVPASGNKWPNLSCEYLRETISMAEKLMIEKNGEVGSELSFVQLWGYIVTPGTALEPRTVEWKRINELIIERGLAIRDSIVPPQPSNVTDSIIPSANVETNDLLNLEVPLPISNVKAWKPPLFPTKDFMGIPSYIDNDFNIYILDSQNNTDILVNINNVVAQNFENSTPQPQDMFWDKGQPCIALYDLDSKYYRAEVVDVLENNNMRVRFVDYGNVEVCPISSLRKNMILADVPIQAYKCRIVGVKPIGDRWKQETIDAIFKVVVEKECYITVLGMNKEKDVLYIKLNVPPVTDLADFLVMFDLASYDNYPEIIDFFPSISDECHENPDDPDIIVVSETKENTFNAHKDGNDSVHF